MERCGMKVQMLRLNFPFPVEMAKSWIYSISPWTQLTNLKRLLPTVILTKMLLLPDAPKLPSQTILTF